MANSNKCNDCTLNEHPLVSSDPQYLQQIGFHGGELNDLPELRQRFMSDFMPA